MGRDDGSADQNTSSRVVHANEVRGRPRPARSHDAAPSSAASGAGGRHAFVARQAKPQVEGINAAEYVQRRATAAARVDDDDESPCDQRALKAHRSRGVLMAGFGCELVRGSREEEEEDETRAIVEALRSILPCDERNVPVGEVVVGSWAGPAL